MRKYERELDKLAAQYGRRVERTKKGHFKLICIRNEKQLVVVSGTASDYRALKNALSLLKRHNK